MKARALQAVDQLGQRPGGSGLSWVGQFGWLRWLGLSLRWTVAGLLLIGAAGAQAHEMSMAEMSVREVAPGQFVWSWGPPSGSRPVSDDLTPLWPAGCAFDAQTVRCPDKGLVGTLSVDGVGKAYSAAIVRIHWRGGQQRVYTLTAAQPTVQLFGAASDDRGPATLAIAYFGLGVAHILSGIDHLLFVVGLLFLVGFRRRLIVTISAFTLAHSLTLAASALGWLTLRSPPVEALIALSIVLVSAEALRDRETLTRRLPALVALVFGLVHGLGFAGALKDIGLPEQHVTVALLTFNLGVEAGQLVAVGCAWLATWCATWLTTLWATRRTTGPERTSPLPLLRRGLLYSIGTLAAYWSLTPIAAIAS